MSPKKIDQTVSFSLSLTQTHIILLIGKENLMTCSCGLQEIARLPKRKKGDDGLVTQIQTLDLQLYIQFLLNIIFSICVD
jgi:hypothetical protein